MWSPSADSFSDPGSIPGTSTIQSKTHRQWWVFRYKNRPCDKLRQKNSRILGVNPLDAEIAQAVVLIVIRT